jgi:type VI secretion system protein VasD
MRRLVCAGLMSVAGVLAGCTTTAALEMAGTVAGAVLEKTGLKKPEVDPEVMNLPYKVSVRLVASDALNVDAAGRSLSLVTRVYKLRSANAFLQAPYNTFGDASREKAALGDDLVEVRDVLLVPGQRYDVQDKMKREVQFIGIVALFRAPAPQRWRYAFEAPEAEKSGLLIGAHACALSVATGVPVGGLPASQFRQAAVCPT